MWNFVFFFIIAKNCPQDLLEKMLTVSSLCSLTILKISTQVIRLGFEKICGNCLFTTSMDESMRCVTVRGNPAREIERALCFAALGLPLIRSALADICQAKNVFWTWL